MTFEASEFNFTGLTLLLCLLIHFNRCFVSKSDTSTSLPTPLAVDLSQDEKSAHKKAVTFLPGACKSIVYYKASPGGRYKKTTGSKNGFGVAYVTF